MVFIYVLQLKDNKWYIGKTETSKFRIDTHFDSSCSSFTQKYPPEDIYQIIPECDKYDEDKYVKKYMDKFGIDNVRGGSYIKSELTSNEKETIQKELWGANDLCFLCGGDHYVKDCPYNTEDNSFELDEKEMTDKDDERMNWIKYYENQLFELTEGYWLRSSLSSHYMGEMLYIYNKNPNNTIPDKVFTRYDDPPINFKNIKDIKYVLDDKEINTFKGNLLLNKRHNPSKYSIHIILEEKTDNCRHYCIVYNYEFSRLKYPQGQRGGSDFYTEKTKKDIEFKLFMLKNRI